MNAMTDPFMSQESLAPLTQSASRDADFSRLEQRPATLAATGHVTPAEPILAPAVGRLQGFDLLDQPLVTGLAALPGEVLVARAATPLRHGMVGHEVVVCFENGDPRKPIIMGVLQLGPLQETPAVQNTQDAPGLQVLADGERHTIQAEREIVLRCGDASITLTRAGKVIIQGNYILSRSTGYNKIKGAAIDIN
ncbi:MAG: hypothetical protein HY019_00720 [Aquabacterium sp.]|uniref:DUF6484 domain-containing protein n=1 Tax=Aquabacterium sp. TaxID=1872578 RepID=UPI0025BB1DAD|nr:DUF6484 domain-containing protein [Aquabacterium sp.]MBI3380502.1 hypothetical protein [Aquabacterium sp.]